MNIEVSLAQHHAGISVNDYFAAIFLPEHLEGKNQAGDHKITMRRDPIQTILSTLALNLTEPAVYHRQSQPTYTIASAFKPGHVIAGIKPVHDIARD